MAVRFKKYQRQLLVLLIVVCMAVILVGSIRYLRTLQDNLARDAVSDVVTVTMQQKQAFDDFIKRDRDRLRGYAAYFSVNQHEGPEDLTHLLTLFQGVDATCVITCLDEGWACSSMDDAVLQLTPEQLAEFESLTGSGVRDDYTGVFSGNQKFGYYETFAYPNGHRGVIEKGYDRSDILETFTLSLYDGKGYGYILDREGDILLRSVPSTSAKPYANVFDALRDTHAEQESVDTFRNALQNDETGHIIVSGDNGRYVYTYAPLDSVEEWYLLSIVPVDAIRDAADSMVHDSQTTMGLFGMMLLVCVVLALLILRTQRDMNAKDEAVSYQKQMFSIFTEFLCRNTDDIYLMYDHETEELAYASPNLGRVLGIEPEEVHDYFVQADMEANAEETEAYYAAIQALKPGETGTSRICERVNPRTGEHRFFLESAYCAQLQGKPVRVAYLSDRTRERKHQNSLADALRIAQSANEAKSAFLGNVSHDIRTPMNAIIGFLSLMRSEAHNPEMVLEYTQRIDAASQHLLGLINDVLDMNKIESGSTTLGIVEMNLAEIIDEINTIIRPQTKARSQKFDIYVSHMHYEHLMGDKLRINQVLINLLSNAVKYTPEGGAIQMRVEELNPVVNSHSRIRFTVSDNGLGMSEEYLKVIFDPFTREETKTTYGIQGTGLGMAITKSLVDLMGGDIRVESKLGEGSTFTVELELRIQEREDDPKFWDDHRVTKMIVADDDEEVCRNIVKAMGKVGVAVEYATDGHTAIEMMRAAREAGEPYDIILLDWKMPTLNGLETARLIRKNYPDKIPILLLTAYDWSDIEQEAMEIGINHFMPKPFFMSTFKEAVRRVMGSKPKVEAGQANVVEGRHILVVDDIEVNRIILVKILTSLGATCDVACNGQEAVGIFEASKPGQYDLILMDVQMPVMDGYEVTRSIRASGHPSAKTVPVIAMTANAFVDDVREAIDSGMDAHIAKPVQLDTLKATISQVFDRRAEQARGEQTV